MIIMTIFCLRLNPDDKEHRNFGLNIFVISNIIIEVISYYV